MKYLIINLLLLMTVLSNTNAQQTIATSGGEATGSGGSSSYTIGQVFYTTQNNSNGSISEGAQQAYEIYVISSIEEADEIKLMIKAYPNPTADILTLDLIDYENRHLVYQLYDMNGSLLKTEELNNLKTKINLGAYPASTYLLRLLDDTKEIKTFKIIKR